MDFKSIFLYVNPMYSIDPYLMYKLVPRAFEKFNCQYLALKLAHSKRPGVKITLSSLLFYLAGPQY
ncbi:hypothetical protein TSAR_000629 [Trichomalopsis sarcophagae]|uniref:Uncharacterized protein n=1 Tax=Trichomalopsis sarcophagae TaxID=543379 RepID=A0A232EPI9_9HYME|nr:hypothetical protein TSAR_000629 [Trichomalopsis sarcophagae]